MMRNMQGYRSRIFFIVFGCAVLLLGGAAVVAWRAGGGSDLSLILHFDVYRGVDRFGTVRDVYAIVAAGFAQLALGFIVGKALLAKEHTLALLIAWVSLLFSLLIFTAMFVILGVN